MQLLSFDMLMVMMLSMSVVSYSKIDFGWRFIRSELFAEGMCCLRERCGSMSSDGKKNQGTHDSRGSAS
jgi:hypothetical protein